MNRTDWRHGITTVALLLGMLHPPWAPYKMRKSDRSAAISKGMRERSGRVTHFTLWPLSDAARMRRRSASVPRFRMRVRSELGNPGLIATKFGCTAETLRRWVRQAERDRGLRAGSTTEERKWIKQLERENRELRQANEIQPKAPAYFAQAELDRRFRP